MNFSRFDAQKNVASRSLQKRGSFIRGKHRNLHRASPAPENFQADCANGYPFPPLHPNQSLGPCSLHLLRSSGRQFVPQRSATAAFATARIFLQIGSESL
jgi:hypothetical protein